MQSYYKIRKTVTFGMKSELNMPWISYAPSTVRESPGKQNEMSRMTSPVYGTFPRSPSSCAVAERIWCSGDDDGAILSRPCGDYTYTLVHASSVCVCMSVCSVSCMCTVVVGLLCYHHRRTRPRFRGRRGGGKSKGVEGGDS